jgi:hypothetical protein
VARRPAAGPAARPEASGSAPCPTSARVRRRSGDGAGRGWWWTTSDTGLATRDTVAHAVAAQPARSDPTRRRLAALPAVRSRLELLARRAAAAAAAAACTASLLLAPPALSEEGGPTIIRLPASDDPSIFVAQQVRRGVARGCVAGT